jgi:hypothetical protein
LSITNHQISKLNFETNNTSNKSHKQCFYSFNRCSSLTKFHFEEAFSAWYRAFKELARWDTLILLAVASLWARFWWITTLSSVYNKKADFSKNNNNWNDYKNSSKLKLTSTSKIQYWATQHNLLPILHFCPLTAFFFNSLIIPLPIFFLELPSLLLH